MLGLDLTGSLADQSTAWLALRLRAQHPLGSGHPADLLTLLAAPAAQTWAKARIAPLGAAGDTVRAWLRADARLPATAAGLGISLPGARKRLTRIEETLGRSLLHAPSAKYELWLAMTALGEL
ncbi:helix-turn-helix domain-containing protein [Streptomyces sp. NPDC051776]|uniref:helix-turn-helix domain-containing protein n=1 Tax=Streptomyces sp. NPDC051776 TaxID=3155414 RepID=UPI00342315A5